MSSFVGLIEPWECEDGDGDSLRWMQEHEHSLKLKYKLAAEARERLLFSAWVNTLRDEWEKWCEENDNA
jgi:hypothetical protein